MKVLQILLFAAMVAIAMEKCAAEYLLVEIEDEIAERRGSMLNARTTNECTKWGEWGQCSESCGNGIIERVCINTAGKSGKESGLPKETKRCQIRNNNCEEPRYSLITDKGTCIHVSGIYPFKCSGYDDIPLSLCEDHCTSTASCIGYNIGYLGSIDKDSCLLIPSERNCPSGFKPIFETGPIAASIKDLIPKEWVTSDRGFVCYGKI